MREKRDWFYRKLARREIGQLRQLWLQLLVFEVNLASKYTSNRNFK